MGLALTTGDADRSPLAAYEPRTTMAEGPLKPLEYFLGTWEIKAEWSWGDTLEARNIFEMGPGGNSLIGRTIVSDNGGVAYERYVTVFTRAAGNEDHVEHAEANGELAPVVLNAHGFSSDGSVMMMNSTLSTSPEGGVAISSVWTTDEGMTIDQTVTRIDAGRYSWVVEMTQPDADEPQRVMDGVYIRKD